MDRGKEYEGIHRKSSQQDKWHLQRRREIRQADEDARIAQLNAKKEKAIQAKLEISQEGDVHEQQADLIAKKVVNGGDANVNQLSPASTSVQSKSEGGGMQASDQLQAKLESSKGSGQSMDDATKGEMETKMGTDFSDVKIHTGAHASEMSESINAKAFTHGQDVYFKGGNYNPSSDEGKELLAHELTHTVQQQMESGISRSIMRDGDETPAPVEDKTKNDGQNKETDKQNEQQPQGETDFFAEATQQQRKIPQEGANIPETPKVEAKWAHIDLPPLEDRKDITWKTPITKTIKEKYHWDEVMGRFAETSPVGKEGMGQTTLNQWVMKNLSQGWTSDMAAPSIFETIVLPNEEEYKGKMYPAIEAFSGPDAFAAATNILHLTPNAGQGYLWIHKNSGKAEYSGYGFSVHSEEGMKNYDLNKDKESEINFDTLATYSGDQVHADNVKKLPTFRAKMYSDDFYELVSNLQRVFVMAPKSTITVTGVYDAATAKELKNRETLGTTSATTTAQTPLEYNQKNCTYSTSLVEKLYKVYEDKSTYDKVIADKKITNSFVTLVKEAQSVTHLDDQTLVDGKLSGGELGLIDAWLAKDMFEQDVDRIVAHYLSFKFDNSTSSSPDFNTIYNIDPNKAYTYSWTPDPKAFSNIPAPTPQVAMTYSGGSNPVSTVTAADIQNQQNEANEKMSIDALALKYSNTIATLGRYYIEESQTFTSGSSAEKGNSGTDNTAVNTIQPKTFTTAGGKRDRVDDLRNAVQSRISGINDKNTQAAIDKSIANQQKTPKSEIRSLEIQQMSYVYRALNLLPADNEKRKIFLEWIEYSKMVTNAEWGNIPPPPDYKDQFGVFLDKVQKNSWYHPGSGDYTNTTMMPAPPSQPKIPLDEGVRDIVVVSGLNLRQALYDEVIAKRQEEAFSTLANEWESNQKMSYTISHDLLGENAVDAPEHKYTHKLQCWFITDDQKLEQAKNADPRFGALTSVKGSPINIYWTKDEGKYYTKMILTPDVIGEGDYEGDSLYGSLVTMRKHNLFPNGTLYFVDEDGSKNHIETYGGKLLSEQLGEASLGLFLLALVAAPFTEGLSLVLFYGSAATGAASAGVHIGEMQESGTMSGGALALDILNIAAALLPAAGKIVQATREASEVAQGVKLGSTITEGEQVFQASITLVGATAVGVNTVYFTSNFITQYRALDNIPEPQRSEMQYQLIMSALIFALVTYHAVKGGGKSGEEPSNGKGVKFIAKTGFELKTHLLEIVDKPIGISYKGKTYRYIGSEFNNPTEIHPGVTDEGNRFRKGLYLSESKEGNMIEVEAYGGTKGKTLYEISDFEVDNLLDITDPNVIETLGTTFEQMKLKDVGNSYEYTHEVAIWAKDNGYSGIKFYGAQGAPDYVNFVIFEQSTVNTSIKGVVNPISW